METKAPGATIVLTGIFPRNDNLAVMPIINKINDNLSQFADGKKIRFLMSTTGWPIGMAGCSTA